MWLFNTNISTCENQVKTKTQHTEPGPGLNLTWNFGTREVKVGFHFVFQAAHWYYFRLHEGVRISLDSECESKGMQR